MNITVECKRQAFRKHTYMTVLGLHYHWLSQMLSDIKGNLILRPLYYDNKYTGLAICGKAIYEGGIFKVCINLRIACNSSDKGFDTIAHEAAHVATMALHRKMLHDALFRKYYREFLNRWDCKYSLESIMKMAYLWIIT